MNSSRYSRWNSIHPIRIRRSHRTSRNRSPSGHNRYTNHRRNHRSNPNWNTIHHSRRSRGSMPRRRYYRQRSKAIVQPLSLTELFSNFVNS